MRFNFKTNEKHTKIWHRIMICLFSFCAIVAISLGLIAAFSDIEPSGFYAGEEARILDYGWYYTNDDGETIECSLPLNASDIHTNTFTLKRMLDEVFVDPTTVIVMRSSQQALKVTIEGKLIYEYGYDSHRPFGKSNGSIWNVIRIPPEDAGKEICFEFTSSYQDYVGVVKEAMIGTKTATLYKLITEYGGAVFFSIVLFLLSLILIILYFVINRQYKYGYAFGYIGLFFALIAIWMFCESKITQFLINNNFVINILIYFSLMLSPIPLLKYCDYVQHGRYNIVFFSLIGLNVLSFIICTILQLTNVFDYYEMLVGIHTIIAISMVGATICTIYDIVKYKKRDCIALLVAIIVISIFVGIEIAHFYEGNDMDHGRYVAIGIVLGAIIITVDMGVSLANSIKQSKDVDYYKRLATTDVLTKSLNRNAYIEKLNVIASNIAKCPGLTLISIDLNYLKNINDTYGHSIGDDALRQCATIVESIFGSYGTCYRIGGDEFAVIIPVIEKDYLENLIKVFHQKCDKVRSEKEYIFEVAIGYAIYDSALDNDVNAVFNRADAHMYSCKETQKKRQLGIL